MVRSHIRFLVSPGVGTVPVIHDWSSTENNVYGKMNIRQ